MFIVTSVQFPWLLQVAKDNSVEKLVIRLTTWYIEKEDEGTRKACGQALNAMSVHASDILKRHAAKAMPLAFFAMHEQENKGLIAMLTHLGQIRTFKFVKIMCIV